MPWRLLLELLGRSPHSLKVVVKPPIELDSWAACAHEFSQSYACTPLFDQSTWKVSVWTPPLVVGRPSMTYRCGVDIPSK